MFFTILLLIWGELAVLKSSTNTASLVLMAIPSGEFGSIGTPSFLSTIFVGTISWALRTAIVSTPYLPRVIRPTNASRHPPLAVCVIGESI